ncbi:MAG: fatty acid desaturase [Pseudomonadota bacterium]
MSEYIATDECRTLEKAPPGVPWHDLTPMGPTDTLREILLPLPWLVLSLALYASPVWWLGPAASFMFFLCALRLNHEAIHSNLGLSRGGDSIVMHGLSALMLGSNHAFSHCHMVHHRHAMGPDDHEGHCGHMSFGQVMRYGPRFGFDVNRAAWRGGRSRLRRRIAIDWALNASVIAVTLALGHRFLLLHVAAMATAQCFTALFAVWITHQGAEHSGVAARSQRGILARAAYLMFYHREHHLFPKVPVRKLPILAHRLDAGVPGYAEARLPVVAWAEWGRWCKW